MTEQDERDLSRVFEELRAPGSTARYEERAGRGAGTAGGPGSGSHWRQALAGGLAVVVAAGAAVTFLAVRNARQTDSTAGLATAPSARTGAAMAFDSTSGVTVMYGGFSGSAVLADTWTWDGSSWRPASGSGPGTLGVARMVDDPADGGVLLIGIPTSASSGGGVACASGGSSGSGGSSVPPASPVPGSSATGESPVATSAAASTAPSASNVAGPVTTKPPVASPPGGTTATGPAMPVPAPSDCPSSTPGPPAPGLQTWLHTSAGGWTKLADATGIVKAAVDTPSPEAQLAFDDATQAVVAITGGGFCGLAVNAAGGGRVCPVMGAPASSSGGAGMCAPNTSCAIPMPCLVTPNGGCAQPAPLLITQTWSHGRWHRQPDVTTGALATWGTTVALVQDTTSGHATLIGQTVDTGCAPTADVACPLSPQASSYWRWTGSTWVAKTGTGAPTTGVSPGTTTLIQAGGRVLAVSQDGHTWSWDAGHWQQLSATGGPSPRYGAAIAAGPASTIVLFGGMYGGVYASTGIAATVPSAPPLGSDTWVLTGITWRHAGGVPPPVPSIGPPASCPPGGKPLAECVLPQPATGLPGSVPPATAVPGGAPTAPSPTASPAPSR